MDIQTTLLTSLRKLAERHTRETLGNRREYLGASDIGYCPRKVILEKIHLGVCLT
jgi:CRISPR-associated exonuclease Cas4